MPRETMFPITGGALAGVAGGLLTTTLLHEASTCGDAEAAGVAVTALGAEVATTRCGDLGNNVGSLGMASAALGIARELAEGPRVTDAGGAVDVGFTAGLTAGTTTDLAFWVGGTSTAGWDEELA